MILPTSFNFHELLCEGTVPLVSSPWNNIVIIWAADFYLVEETLSFLLRPLPSDRRQRLLVRLRYLSLCLIHVSSLVFGLSSHIQSRSQPKMCGINDIFLHIPSSLNLSFSREKACILSCLPYSSRLHNIL